ELEFVIADVDAAVVIWQDAEIGDAVREAREASGSKALWLQHDASGAGSYEELLSAGSPVDVDVVVEPSLPVLQMYTAAFAGTPNGALLSHTAILVQDLVMGMLQEI